MASAFPAIDADGHILERQEEIRPYLDERWRARSTQLWPGVQPWDAHLSGKITRPCGYARKLKAKEQVGVWNQILEDHDIEQAILFTTGSGNASKLQEPAFAVAVSTAVNRHLAHDYLTDRLHPVGVLPMRDPDAAAREVERAAGLGLRAFEILTDGLPFGLGDPFFDPVYQAAESANVAICIHGSRSAAHEWGADKLKTFAEVHCYGFPAGMLLNFTSVMAQGVPVRFPRLRLAFLEIGATWLPYYLDRLDEHWEKRGEDEMPHLAKKPSAIFRDSTIKVSIEGKESLLRETIDFVGVEHLLYATDIPHWDGEFPENLEEIREANVISDAERRAILHDNARELYAI
jgi:predicted TIM-barrel fold metal-dependent hydrolase